jgi:16S rRNA (cytosine967-C5)-methyltransferase
MSSPQKNGVSQGRLWAHAVLVRVARDGAYAERALHALLGRVEGDVRDKALATALVYGVLRNVRYVDFLIGFYAQRRVKKLPYSVMASLRLGVYQLVAMRAPAHAVVHDAVALVRKEQPRLAGFVNAVLRACAKAQEEGTLVDVFASVANPLEALATAYSHPVWLLEKLWPVLGEEGVRAFCKANNEPAKVAYRVRKGCTGLQMQERWVAQGYEVRVCAEPFSDVIEAEPLGPVWEVPGFAQGDVVVQDPAAGLAARMVDAQEGWRVWDMCAAPGGKSVQLAECVGDSGRVWSTDVHASKISLIQQNAERCGVQNRMCIRVLDASDATAVQNMCVEAHTDLFDAVLLDAPCSGMGTLRRNPELRDTGYGRVLELCALQDKLLDMAASKVRVGGVLVYAVCTVTEEEGPERVQAFLQKHPDFVTDDKSVRWPSCTDASGAVRTWPHVHGTDGFYAVRMLRL